MVEKTGRQNHMELDKATAGSLAVGAVKPMHCDGETENDDGMGAPIDESGEGEWF